ncbi:MAG: sodium:proton antiporter [Pirellulaceae bacterium]|nr:sodium:proton antiporter [Pirellulaceae bacterium]
MSNDLTPASISQHRYFAPAAIAAAMLLALLGGQVATEHWIVKYLSIGGAQVAETAELEQAADALKTRILDEQVSSLSSVVPPESEGVDDNSVRVTVGHHFGAWSVLPALVTLAFCLVFREPLPALLLGILSAALLLCRYDVTDDVLLPGLASTSAAGIMLLYLWLLGGLLGVWSKTGAALAFADWTCRTFVRGPRSAKLVAWGLGVLFFQGGTISTVLVGTTVRPVTERNKISPEELSYVVDSTASPIASLIAFNAWPAYVQSLIFVPGIAYLATKEDRIAFFFKCAPLSFYSIFAVLGTFLIAIDKAPFLGRRFRAAIKRSRSGRQDESALPAIEKVRGDTVEPTGYQGDASDQIAVDYSANPLEFVIPLVALIAIAVGTGFTALGPQVRWAFAAAFVLAAGIALCRGLSLPALVDGVGEGLKSVTVASVILLLAVVLGGLTKELGGGLYVSAALGENIPHLLLPAVLFVLTGSIAFATGTSFGTYAIAFPLTMPLSIFMAADMPPESGQWFVMICFAAVLNGSVFGDQCSPISDTTILSSLVSGCDLMEHVRTQLVPATIAGGLAMVAWTALTAWAT